MELRGFIDRKTSRVVFAESDENFIDILLSFLTLPMGTIVRLVRNQSQPSVIGSMNTLYQGVEDLEERHFLWKNRKQMLLHPVNSSEHLCRKLKLNIDDTEPAKYYTCDCCSFSEGKTLFSTSPYWCCKGKSMNKVMHLSDEAQSGWFGCGVGVFVKASGTFVITDDLKIIPMSSSACIQLLKKYGVEELVYLEELTLKIGLDEVLSLLRLLFVSGTPLTDLFFPKNRTPTAMFEVRGQPHLEKVPHNNTTEKITLNVIKRKSDKKILYAEAQSEFVNYLLSQLTIPLGTIVGLLQTSTSLQCISNLYNSVRELEVGVHLKSDHKQKMLLSPKLGPHFCYPIRPLGIEEYYSPEGRCMFQFADSKLISMITEASSVSKSTEEDGFIQWEKPFMITDDLTVMPLSAKSCISVFNKFEVLVSDIEEQKVDFGKEEALKLLEASLISESALTNAFNFNPSMKQPKLEK